MRITPLFVRFFCSFDIRNTKSNRLYIQPTGCAFQSGVMGTRARGVFFETLDRDYLNGLSEKECRSITERLYAMMDSRTKGCPFCGSSSIIRKGYSSNGVQRYACKGCAKMGIDYVVSSPKELEPSPELLAKCREIAAHSSITVINDPKEAVKGADAVYTDVWVSMGEEALKEERYRLLGGWQVNSEIMAATGKASTIFLHCLPAVKGCEVTEEVFESEQSRVFDEAENRMHTIKAVMVATLGA